MGVYHQLEFLAVPEEHGLIHCYTNSVLRDELSNSKVLSRPLDHWLLAFTENDKCHGYFSSDGMVIPDYLAQFHPHVSSNPYESPRAPFVLLNGFSSFLSKYSTDNESSILHDYVLHLDTPKNISNGLESLGYSEILDEELDLPVLEKVYHPDF